MSKLEFVPYEDNIVLIELGLNIGMEFINHCYDEDKCLFSIREMDDIEEEWMPAITFSQAFRFFRDEHKCYYYIEPIWRNSKIRYEWCVDNTANSEKLWEEEQICITYEEAELECLKSLLFMILNN